MTQAEGPKRARYSGLPSYNTPLDLPSDQADQAAGVGCSTSGGAPGVAGTIETVSTNAELLRCQLGAVEALYGVYKVEHYALLEEMRLAHGSFKVTGRAALKDEPKLGAHASSMGAHGQAHASVPAAGGAAASAAHCTPPAPPAPASMRELLASKRARDVAMRAAVAAAPKTEESQGGEAPGPAAPAPPGADDSDLEGGSPGPAATFTGLASSAATPAPPHGASSAHAFQGHDSPAGVSLNAWVRPGGAPPGGTPQSSAPTFSRLGAQPAAAAAAQQCEGRGEHSAGAAGCSGRGEPPALARGGEGCASAADVRAGGGGAPAAASLAMAGYGEPLLGYGSDADPGEYTDLEDEVLRPGGGAPAAPDGQAGAPSAAQWRTRFRAAGGHVAALESLASAVSQQQLDGFGGAGCSALAALVTRSGRFLITRPTVLLGRGSGSKGAVDVDLSAATPAAKVSRRQAFLSLQPDGRFVLENIGRRPLHIDGRPLPQFASADLGHLSLLEAGGVRALFMVNAAAVKRALARSARLAV
ncbi:hypothetical protein FOA52_011897 [Chlamydomonas sp. UWO 241]|nr:hypothetical protein FOA52_011897 [Chlamydomonas sp. UWO 241]